MKFMLLILTFVLIPSTTFAGDKVKGMNFYAGDSQLWETSDGTGFWIWHAKGVTHPTEGPFGPQPIECHGSGFWDKEGSWTEGICVQGSGDDTVKQHWKRNKGQKVGKWEYLSGTGKYTGIKGNGTYTHTDLPAGRGMSEWVGEISLAK